MTILALDCSTNVRSAAIFTDDECVAQLRRDEPARTFSSVVLVQEILKSANLKPSALTKIAVGLGPGSYTGIRSCIALAQGMQLALNILVHGINSFEAMAHGAWVSGMRGVIRIAMDAQRGELYVATYFLDDTGATQRQPLHLLPLAEAIKDPTPLAGPDMAKLRSDGLDLYPEVKSLVALLPKAGAGQTAELLEPIYGRQTSFLKAPAPRRTINS